MGSATSARHTETPVTPRREVWFAAWPVTAVFILSNTATPLYVLWRQELGFSSGMLTVVFACYIVGLIAALLVAGVVSDRVGRKPVLLPALALGIVASVLFATAGSIVALALARLLSGVAVGSIVSAGMAAVTDVAGPDRKRLAALLASTAMVLGAGLGPLLAGILSETLPGPTVTVFLVEIALLVLAVLAVLRMPLRRPAAAPRPATGPRPGAWVRVPSVPRANRVHLLLGIVVFAPGITSTSFVLSLGPSLLAELLGTTSRVVAGATAFVMFTAATAVQFAVRRLRVGAILTAGAASTALAMASLALAVQLSSAPLLALAAVLAGAGQGMGQLGGLTLISAQVPAARLAEANAALNVGGYVPAGLLPVAVGYLSDAVGLSRGTTVFSAVVAAAALAGGAVVLANRRTTP
ncbi:MFS transporter [Streptomyces sp. NBS 14/10]|uniref:MFS transporter n=1 Tax=Streptomyces sp. NBS 14/10 TaxID=1945643 RepID=UPI000B7EA4CB|nr:MFS transporter [Streptomyces sp. NBS 14/10]KAK1177465.1 MFS transporter [Streptomyces sp. NBS 14/10]